MDRFFGVLPYGDEWRAQRRIFQQYFGQGRVSQQLEMHERMLRFIRKGLLPNLLMSPQDYREHLGKWVAHSRLSCIKIWPLQLYWWLFRINSVWPPCRTATWLACAILRNGVWRNSSDSRSRKAFEKFHSFIATRYARLDARLWFQKRSTRTPYLHRKTSGRPLSGWAKIVGK